MTVKGAATPSTGGKSEGIQFECFFYSYKFPNFIWESGWQQFPPRLSLYQQIKYYHSKRMLTFQKKWKSALFELYKF